MAAKENKSDFVAKLVNMIRKGTGAESGVAERKLREYCKKNGLDYDNLISAADEEKISNYIFKLKPLPHIVDLFRQVVGVVMNTYKPEVLQPRDGRRAKTLKIVQCTLKQKIEIDVMFGLMQDAYEKEFEDLVNAFIQRNMLFPATSDVPKDIPDPDYEKAHKIVRMSMTMGKVNVNPQIGEIHDVETED